MIRIGFWAATFLVFLRIAIGWHFFHEGMHKIHTSEVGETKNKTPGTTEGTYLETPGKPWSSEGFFREAEGPAGPLMRELIGDPDKILQSYLTLGQETDAKTPAARFPVSLAKEWNRYIQRWKKEFPNSADKLEGQPLEQIEKIKMDYVLWILTGKKEIEKKGPTGKALEVTLTTRERIDHYLKLYDRVRNIYQSELPTFQKDVEKGRLRALKSELAADRSSLQLDVDGYTKQVKDILAKLIAPNQLITLDKALNELKPDQWLSAFTPTNPPADKKNEEAEAKALPEILTKVWDDYGKSIIELAPLTDVQRIDMEGIIRRSKIRLVRDLLDQDEFTGEPRSTVVDDRTPIAAQLKQLSASVAAWQALPKPDKLDDKSDASKKYLAAQKKATQEFASLKKVVQSHFDTLQGNLNSFRNDDQLKGYAHAEPSSNNLVILDQMTSWSLTIFGACLILGLFTRLACLGAAGFLFLTFLSAPPFPWLPASPMTEGNYAFINKNLIEMFALLVLSTTYSGRWVGLDGMLSYILGGIFGSRKQKGIAVQTSTQNNQASLSSLPPSLPPRQSPLPPSLPPRR